MTICRAWRAHAQDAEERAHIFFADAPFLTQEALRAFHGKELAGRTLHGNAARQREETDVNHDRFPTPFCERCQDSVPFCSQSS